MKDVLYDVAELFDAGNTDREGKIWQKDSRCVPRVLIYSKAVEVL